MWIDRQGEAGLEDSVSWDWVGRTAGGITFKLYEKGDLLYHRDMLQRKRDIMNGWDELTFGIDHFPPEDGYRGLLGFI